MEVEVKFDSEGSDSVDVTVAYGDQEKTIRTDSKGEATVKFTAQNDIGKITGYYAGSPEMSSAEAVPTSIHVPRRGWGDVIKLGLAVFVLYALTYAYRRYGGLLVR